MSGRLSRKTCASNSRAPLGPSRAPSADIEKIDSLPVPAGPRLASYSPPRKTFSRGRARPLLSERTHRGHNAPPYPSLGGKRESSDPKTPCGFFQDRRIPRHPSDFEPTPLQTWHPTDPFRRGHDWPDIAPLEKHFLPAEQDRFFPRERTEAATLTHSPHSGGSVNRRIRRHPADLDPPSRHAPPLNGACPR
jgi:hypothetical protein